MVEKIGFYVDERKRYMAANIMSIDFTMGDRCLFQKVVDLVCFKQAVAISVCSLG